MSDPLFAVFYIKVRRRKIGGYSGRELVGRMTDKPPKNVGKGEYVVPIRLRVPRACLDRTADYQDVTVAEPEGVEAAWENS